MNKYIHAIRASAAMLPKGDERKILTVTIVQVALSFLDLIGVALVGIVGAVSISGIQSQQPGGRTQKVLNFLQLGNLDFYKQVVVLSILSAGFLVGRTIFSMVFTRRYLRFLGYRSASITSSLFSKLISQDILGVQNRNSQETLFLLTEGVRRITVGILGNLVFLVADISLLTVLALGLLLLDPIVAVVTFLLFSTVALILHQSMSNTAQRIGRINSEVAISSNRKIVEAITSYRELFVHNRRNFYTRTIEAERLTLSAVDAQMAFLPMISKYVLESAVVIGAFIVAGLQFALNDSRHAIATLVIFMAAGSRIGPAIMRVQQGVIQIGLAIGSSAPTLELAKELQGIEVISPTPDRFTLDYIGFNPTVKVSNLSFNYPDSNKIDLSEISFDLQSGETLAIVGSSGAGKTTLVDLLLGILTPSSGMVLIGNQSPIDAISNWAGGISYVPQDVAIMDGTVRENICMGYAIDAMDDNQIWKALTEARLNTFVKSLPKGLDTQIGDRGSKISGGERQRLGIARALLTNPKLLILDEATSALDGNTEAEISDSIQMIKGSVTVILIAHRLSTVRTADKVLYLECGRQKAIGTFTEVRAEVPNFDVQAKLMGL